MRTYLLLVALIGISFSGGNLSGEDIHHISAHAYLVEPPIVEQITFVEEETEAVDVYEEAVIPEVELESEVVEVVEVPEVIEIAEVPEGAEIQESELIEEPLTYDLLHQKDVGEEEEIVPPEVSETWYVEDTAILGLEMIFATYAVSDYDFFIVSTPSNYIYQYDFYVDSPDGEHAHLLGIYQYDATGHRTFFLNPKTGSWESANKINQGANSNTKADLR